MILRFFSINVNQNNVGANLPNVLPTNRNLRITSQEVKQLAASWHHDLTDAPFTLIKLQIANSSQLPAIPDIDHVLILQLRKCHSLPQMSALYQYMQFLEFVAI